MEGKTLAFAVVLTAFVGMGLGMLLLFAGGPPPAPERPQPPPPTEALINTQVKFSPTIYRALLEEDAKAYGLPAMTPAQMAAPNPYFEEWNGHKRLKGKEVLETPHLKLSMIVGKQQGGRVEGQTYAVDHLILRIENKTPSYLAYRVETEVLNKKKCSTKGDISHNAIVIEPNQTIVRTECLYRSDETVDITHVEVIEMPPLSAYYVSRLPPALVLYDPRTAAGHQTPKGKPCPQNFSWRDVREGAERKELGWRDVMDFYARHNCDEYAFFREYRYRVSPEEPPLPVRPPDSR